jgi:TonB family protein
MMLPNQPKVEPEIVGAVSGHRYIAVTSAATYTVWSMRNANYQAGQDPDAYLDTTAELIWDGLLKPAREKLEPKDRLFAWMTYERELPREALPGREYSLRIGDVEGAAEFFVAREHLYVLLAMGKLGADWPKEKFFASFRASSSSLAASSAVASSLTKPLENAVIAPRTSASEGEDYNRVFTGREVTQKVRILEKKEPTYTESAREFSVEGTVVLRAVFSKSGEVTNLQIVRKLPHGLTQRAIEAARAIRFEPAIKDGHPVSMWMELQYNFNFY